MIPIDDHLAREASKWAERTGRSLVQYVEDAIAGELLSPGPIFNRTTPDVTGLVLIPAFGGDGVVDGLTLDEAVARADFELDVSIAKGKVRPDAVG